MRLSDSFLHLAVAPFAFLFVFVVAPAETLSSSAILSTTYEPFISTKSIPALLSLALFSAFVPPATAVPVGSDPLALEPLESDSLALEPVGSDPLALEPVESEPLTLAVVFASPDLRPRTFSLLASVLSSALRQDRHPLSPAFSAHDFYSLGLTVLDDSRSEANQTVAQWTTAVSEYPHMIPHLIQIVCQEVDFYFSASAFSVNIPPTIRAQFANFRLCRTSEYTPVRVIVEEWDKGWNGQQPLASIVPLLTIPRSSAQQPLKFRTWVNPAAAREMSIRHAVVVAAKRFIVSIGMNTPMESDLALNYFDTACRSRDPPLASFAQMADFFAAGGVL